MRGQERGNSLDVLRREERVAAVRGAVHDDELGC
jgi:hypothetical protein